ncbi:helix-turn-helix domain-containing protein [Sulfitobacter sp. SH24]|uniref:helix-turn-helix domain-containing protein n=1 Tax=Sulfitobacter sp. SH24 TaxID=3421173 RepID=UPI003F50404D
MNLLDKERLARRHDDSPEACAARLRAARLLTGLNQKDAAREAGAGQTAWNNAENARNYPQLNMMRWLYRAHRVDFNFILAGEFAQLPTDVRDAIFDILESQTSVTEPDRKASSRSPQNE